MQFNANAIINFNKLKRYVSYPKKQYLTKVVVNFKGAL